MGKIPEVPDSAILDEKIISDGGTCITTRYWIEGHHDYLGGRQVNGWRGPETIIEITTITALDTFTVVDNGLEPD